MKHFLETIIKYDFQYNDELEQDFKSLSSENKYKILEYSYKFVSQGINNIEAYIMDDPVIKTLNLLLEEGLIDCNTEENTNFFRKFVKVLINKNFAAELRIVLNNIDGDLAQEIINKEMLRVICQNNCAEVLSIIMDKIHINSDIEDLISLAAARGSIDVLKLLCKAPHNEDDIINFITSNVTAFISDASTNDRSFIVIEFLMKEYAGSIRKKGEFVLLSILQDMVSFTIVGYDSLTFKCLEFALNIANPHEKIILVQDNNVLSKAKDMKAFDILSVLRNFDEFKGDIPEELNSWIDLYEILSRDYKVNTCEVLQVYFEKSNINQAYNDIKSVLDYNISHPSIETQYHYLNYESFKHVQDSMEANSIGTFQDREEERANNFRVTKPSGL
ncbi:MAG: hypothetical protein J0G32_01085 [Alphaproteobacteria bacterium]|nr:hypothetical protein [Alphaproteobacteria bacterium]OJV13212.1 MAG: hypothetical protein BGO27_00205 [Alphaproteobacteria bacterium 33-17]